MIFKNSAEYYDVVYGGKDYKKEVDFAIKAISKFSSIKVKNILSLGCCTANHDILMAKRGFSITGIDGSKLMINIAKRKAKESNVAMDFLVSDITKFKMAKKYDAAMAMFNIIGYMAENESMERALKNVSDSLKKNSIFMFDCWYGPAVLKDRPYNRSKTFKKGKISFTRKTTQNLNIEKSIIDITFNFVKNNKSFAIEIHKMRFWFLKELEYFLGKNGFKILKTCNFLDMNSKVSEKNWNIFIVAMKR